MKSEQGKQKKYVIEIDDHKHEVDDPLIDGREILRIADKNPTSDFILFQWLKNGQLEEIRQDEKVDLRDKGRETFITFESDRCFRLKINETVFSWGSNLISGRWLYNLAKIDPDEETLWLISIGGEDREIKPNDMVDLEGVDVECFMTRQKYSICIEGKSYPWPNSTITTEQIAELGGWDVGKGVVAIDKDQNERQLKPGEIVSLKGGLSFCKKQSFKRGLNEESRIVQELRLLEKYYPIVMHKKVDNLHWIYIEGLALPEPLSPSIIKVCFSITDGYPAAKPYGFFMPPGIKRKDILLDFKQPPHAPPFDGIWHFKSWDAPHWSPGIDVLKGDNLWAWVRSFRQGIAEGP